MAMKNKSRLPPGRIRLACRRCDRDDHDMIAKIPADWSDVERVQTYRESIADVAPGDIEHSILDWFTHVGCCPACRHLAPSTKHDEDYDEGF